MRDPRMHATLARLEALFDAAYPINQQRPRERAPAMGRYRGRRLLFRRRVLLLDARRRGVLFPAAAAHAPGSEERAQVDRSVATAFLATVRAFTPPSGDLSEQFDQRTRRADFRETSGVELRGVHFLRDGASGGGRAMTETDRHRRRTAELERPRRPERCARPA